MEKIVEICCGSYEDAYNADRAGAKRIELNSALHLGGLTPSLATLVLTKKNTNLLVISMLRPRGAGFHYSDVDYEVMKMDAELLMKNGSDGLAFGFLTEDGEVDKEKTAEIVKIIKEYNGEAVFHRAFDCVADPYKTMETLIELGIDRVLTSGLEPKAIEGKEVIKNLQEKYGDKIEILAGSGVNVGNMDEIMDYTGINQVHSSCKAWVEDQTTHKNNVSYSYASAPNEMNYDVVSYELVKNMIENL